MGLNRNKKGDIKDRDKEEFLKQLRSSRNIQEILILPFLSKGNDAH
jgi:hypothetical protein